MDHNAIFRYMSLAPGRDHSSYDSAAPNNDSSNGGSDKTGSK